mgnify:FL=1|jgi:hypothetical protein
MNRAESTDPNIISPEASEVEELKHSDPSDSKTENASESGLNTKKKNRRKKNKNAPNTSKAGDAKKINF